VSCSLDGNHIYNQILVFLMTIGSMHILTDAENQIIDRLRLAYYEVVPAEFRTYCSLTSRISQAVLHKFSILSELMPCQLWYTNQTQNYVVGFLNNAAPTPEWNGHVVCRAGNVILDAATQNLEVKLGVQVPWVVVARRFMVSTQLISRARLDSNAMLEWFYPPKGVETDPPSEPTALIDQYSDLLFQKISKPSE
jgi:hypothetical protein